MIRLNNTEALQKTIGKSVQYIRSSAMNVHEGHIWNMAFDLSLAFKKGTLQFKSGELDFWENEEGEVYYDYDLIYSEEPSTEISSLHFESEPISKVEVYGREFRAEEFRSYLNIYEKVKNVNQTDDLFLFHFSSGQRLLIIYHWFLPQIQAYFKESEITSCLNSAEDLYKLHHTIS